MKALLLSGFGLVIIVKATLFMVDMTLAGQVAFADREAAQWDAVAEDAADTLASRETFLLTVKEAVKLNTDKPAAAYLAKLQDTAQKQVDSGKRWAARSKSVAASTREEMSVPRAKAQKKYEEHCILCLESDDRKRLRTRGRR